MAIGKIVKGCYFRGVLDYLANKKDAKLIGGNMFGTTPKDLAKEFAASRQLNYRLKKIVNHVSLSLPIAETINEKTWNKIAREYIEAMGFLGSQYVVYRHADRQCDHIHIVASRVKISDGKTVRCALKSGSQSKTRRYGIFYGDREPEILKSCI